MVRVNYHLTERQLERLRRLSENTGRSVAELIRNAVDSALDKEDRHKDKESGNL